jgi:hypothetical protein
MSKPANQRSVECAGSSGTGGRGYRHTWIITKGDDWLRIPVNVTFEDRSCYTCGIHGILCCIIIRTGIKGLVTLPAASTPRPSMICGMKNTLHFIGLRCNLKAMPLSRVHRFQ